MSGLTSRLAEWGEEGVREQVLRILLQCEHEFVPPLRLRTGPCDVAFPQVRSPRARAVVELRSCSRTTINNMIIS